MVPCSMALLDSSDLRTLTSRGVKEMGKKAFRILHVDTAFI